MSELSSNTKAILLLTAPLRASHGGKSPDSLSPSEYRNLSHRLREVGGQPADLLAPTADQLLRELGDVVPRDRLERLLARGFLLTQAVERWHARAIWVISRADSAYPQRLKARLKEDSPVLLYGCGDSALLNGGGLAIVGSRNVDDALIEYSAEIGRFVASTGRTVISGGARGIDRAAMRSALEAGGSVAGVLPDSLERNAMQRENRACLRDGLLVLISPYDPAAGFNAGHAMQRNKIVYALADAALVVNAEAEKGGTWAGAREQLQERRYVPVYVRSTGAASGGLDALRRLGARDWPNPADADGLGELLSAPAPEGGSRPVQSELALGPAYPPDARPRDGRRSAAPATTRSGERESPEADELFRTVRGLVLRLLDQPRKPAEIAAGLGVTAHQADEWLKRLVKEGLLEKTAPPVRYSIRQSSLFSEDEAASPSETAKAAASGS